MSILHLSCRAGGVKMGFSPVIKDREGSHLMAVAQLVYDRWGVSKASFAGPKCHVCLGKGELGKAAPSV